MSRFLRRMGRDQSGTTTIEFTIVMLLFFMLTFGITEFGFMLWQYNSAAKAAQLGARLAAISNPVWQELTSVTDDGTPGSAWTTAYDVTCSGESGACTGTVPDGAGDTYDADAMQCLVYGRNATNDPPCDDQCAETGIDGENGICDRYPYVTEENVSVEYSHTGLGFAGRPGGPVPTITLRLTGLTFNFFALGALLGFEQIAMPDFEVTMTGEDLNRAGPE
jgi:TadE-like protein